jgi:hypothetical protein
MRSACCPHTHSSPRLSPSLHHLRLQRRAQYDAHDYGHRHTPSPHCRSRASHRYLHGSATVFSTCPSPPSSLPRPPRSSSTPLQPYSPVGSTASAAQQYTTDDPCLQRNPPTDTRSTSRRRADPVRLAPPSTCQYALQQRSPLSRISIPVLYHSLMSFIDPCMK